MGEIAAATIFHQMAAARTEPVFKEGFRNIGGRRPPHGHLHVADGARLPNGRGRSRHDYQSRFARLSVPVRRAVRTADGLLDLPADFIANQREGEEVARKAGFAIPGYEAKLNNWRAAILNLKGVLFPTSTAFRSRHSRGGHYRAEITDVEMEDIIPGVLKRGVGHQCRKHIKLCPRGAQLRARTVTPFRRPGTCRLRPCQTIAAAGACGECKVKVRSGQFDQGFGSTWRFRERHQGYGLMCMAKPLSDELEIEWERMELSPNCSRRANRSTRCWWDRILHATHHRVRTETARRNDALLAGAISVLGDASLACRFAPTHCHNAPRPDGEIRYR